MWMRSDFLADREEVDRFLREREYCCVRLAETIERARAFPSRIFDLVGLVHLSAAGIVDGAVTADREGTVHCVLPNGIQEDASLCEFLNFYVSVKKITGPTNDTLRVARGLSSAGCSTQSYTLMRIRATNIARNPSRESDPWERYRIEIRDATESDLAALVSLHRAYEREELLMNTSLPETEFRIRALLNHQMISMALVDGEPVGKINTNARGIFCDQVGGFYVMPGHRGAGIGTALLRSLLSRIEEAEKDAVLYVRSSNAVARRMYERAGFLPAGEYAMSTVRSTH